MTETAAIQTPAADALARFKEELSAAMVRLREGEAAYLQHLRRDALVAKAEARFIDAKRLTKAALVERLANAAAEESSTGQQLRALEEAASVERRILVAIEEAPAAVEKAREAVRKAAEAQAWGPESAADAAMAWERAAAALRNWRAVEERAREVGPEKALVEVARFAASDLLSTVGSGSGRSTDAVRNCIRQADVEGTYRFLKDAARYSREVAALVRY